MSTLLLTSSPLSIIHTNVFFLSSDIALDEKISYLNDMEILYFIEGNAMSL